MEQLINITDAVFLGHVGEVELGASAIAGIYYLAVYMLGFDIFSRFLLFIGIGHFALSADAGKFSFHIGKVDFLAGDLSGCNSIFGLAQFRFAVFVSVFGYPFFSCWNNMHSGIIVGCSRCSSD